MLWPETSLPTRNRNTLLQPLSAEEIEAFQGHQPVSHLYSGSCPATGELLTLPRTPLAEQLARRLVQTSAVQEDKMYGVLIVRTSAGELGWLKAFSGKLEGTFHRPGWAPPMIELDATANEIEVKQRLAALTKEINELRSHQVRAQYERNRKEWERSERALLSQLQKNREKRHERRERGHTEDSLKQESREDSRLKREFKQEKRAALKPLKEAAEQNHRRTLELKKERKSLSRALQKELHKQFDQALFGAEPWSLAGLFPSGPPTGVGECCAPKLLHYAYRYELQPLALAEIWWGEDTTGRTRGEFYPACRSRCQPLLGPLLSRARSPLKIYHQDRWFRVVEKPSGVLTVPGRRLWNQDSLQRRLETVFGEPHFPVHRLDLETSGLVVFARSEEALSELQKLFAERRVKKTYHAVLDSQPKRVQRLIEAPLSRDPERKGCYTVCPQGKEAVTEVEILDYGERRVQFRPLTGRSHQLRVHAFEVLGTPIQGDRLYGEPEGQGRLKLHAHRLEFEHPFTKCNLNFCSQTPF